MSMTPARLGASSTCAVPRPGRPSSENRPAHSCHGRIFMVSSFYSIRVWLMSVRGVTVHPLVVFHAHELHEFGAGLHARQRACVFEGHHVILVIGDGYL